ncbi:prepilin-type N-terminal cleavage/methylation domain-containing protein, partial [bacterium]|nr:prepilin-type N-terminal cleavage/methylation domain-containing protein [bacterium]
MITSSSSSSFCQNPLESPSMAICGVAILPGWPWLALGFACRSFRSAPLMSFRENRKPLVEKTADLHSKKAFTLVELMIVVGCLMLILVPAWRIFHYGTRSSLQGMLKIDTTLEARRILNQVNLDLKQSCWAWDDENNAYYTISDILSASGRFQNRTISFLVFPSKGSLTDAIPQSLEPDVENPSKVVANRRVSKVSYILQPSPKKEGLPQKFPLFSLIREEKFNPKHPLAQSYPEGL